MGYCYYTEMYIGSDVRTLYRRDSIVLIRGVRLFIKYFSRGGVCVVCICAGVLPSRLRI